MTWSPPTMRWLTSLLEADTDANRFALAEDPAAWLNISREQAVEMLAAAISEGWPLVTEQVYDGITLTAGVVHHALLAEMEHSGHDGVLPEVLMLATPDPAGWCDIATALQIALNKAAHDKISPPAWVSGVKVFAISQAEPMDLASAWFTLAGDVASMQEVSDRVFSVGDVEAQRRMMDEWSLLVSYIIGRPVGDDGELAFMAGHGEAEAFEFVISTAARCAQLRGTDMPLILQQCQILFSGVSEAVADKAVQQIAPQELDLVVEAFPPLLAQRIAQSPPMRGQPHSMVLVAAASRQELAENTLGLAGGLAFPKKM